MKRKEYSPEWKNNQNKGKEIGLQRNANLILKIQPGNEKWSRDSLEQLPKEVWGQKNPSAFQKEFDQFMKGTGWCRTWKGQEEDSMAQKTPLSPIFRTMNSHNDGH